MSEPAQKDVPPSAWAVHPDCIITFDPLPARVRVELAGVTVAESDDAHVMYEIGHPPAYYLPRADVREDLLTASAHTTHCPYKGDAGYWHVRADDVTAENAVWTYAQPYPEMAQLARFLGFYWARFDAWYEDGERVDAPREIAGRCNDMNNFAAQYPELARRWHPDNDPRVPPYKFPTDSNAVVWWRDEHGREWQESIRAHVIRDGAPRTRADR